MRKIIIHEFMSLDGVIQAPGGKDEDTDGGFPHGGWTLPYWHDSIGQRFMEFMGKSDTLLLGRRTWQIHGAAFDPMPPGDPFGDPMKAIRKVVVSTTLKDTRLWRNSTLIASDVVGEIRKLKNQTGKHILMDGSSVLAHTLITHGLIDEFHLHVYPLVLGTGKRLFPVGSRVDLERLAAESLPTGITYAAYRLANGEKA